MQSPLFPLYLIPPRSKYSPQHHVLRHPTTVKLNSCHGGWCLWGWGWGGGWHITCDYIKKITEQSKKWARLRFINLLWMALGSSLIERRSCSRINLTLSWFNGRYVVLVPTKGFSDTHTNNSTVAVYWFQFLLSIQEVTVSLLCPDCGCHI